MSFLFKGGKKKRATNIVRNWEKTQVSDIAKDIVRIIPREAPFLRDIAQSSLTGLINKNLEFFAGEPQEVSGNIYSIIDTARVKVGPGIPFIGKQFTISVNYDVKVDVKEKKVVEARPDISSLKIDFI